MDWSPQQDAALLAVDTWLKQPDAPQCFRLFGYAGTGKTTLAKHFSQGVDGQVLFGAFTGKAAHVLMQKGCIGATTIHSLIYHTRDKGRSRLKELESQLIQLKTELAEQGSTPEQIGVHKRVVDIRKLIEQERQSLSRPSFTLNPESAVKEAKLLVIDECSMVDDRMGQDLLSFGTKVLVLGDPAQLPPVGGAGFFTENVTPDIMLEEIHRQAKDSPIIDMATRVRMGETLPLGSYGDSSVIDVESITKEDCLAADQLIVGRNATRYTYNSRMRKLLGHQSPYPEAGDKVVCLRNNHDKGLLNGAVWNVLDMGQVDSDRCFFTIVPQDGGNELTCEVHSHHFLGKGKEIPFYEKKEAEEFDFGYALTCHKAQGSQWNNLIVFDESACFRQDKTRWLYTAITRAAEKLKVVRL